MIGLLLGNWRTIAIAGAIGLLLFGVQEIRVRIAQHHARHVEQLLETARADLARCQGNRATLERSIADQNAAIRHLEEAGRQASQDAAEALQRARAAHARDEARLAALRAPLRSVGACERAEEAADRARAALR